LQWSNYRLKEIVKVSNQKIIIQSGNSEGESCYYCSPQLMALGQISPIFYGANQPGRDIKWGTGGHERELTKQVFDPTATVGLLLIILT
jgi:hypothetical protein